MRWVRRSLGQGGSPGLWRILNAQNCIECPEQSGSGPLEDTRAGSHSIPACWSRKGTVLQRGRPLCRASSHLLPLPFLQTSTSAPLTAPATTSASTPPAASSASATRATPSTDSLIAEVGPAGPRRAGVPGWDSPGAAAVGPLGTLPTPRLRGDGRFHAHPRQGRGSQPDPLVSATSNRATGTICDLSAAGEREREGEIPGVFGREL